MHDVPQVFTDSITYSVLPSASPPLFRGSIEKDLVMVMKAPVRSGGKGYFQQVVCYDLKTNIQVPLTLGDLIVEDILAWDTARSEM